MWELQTKELFPRAVPKRKKCSVPLGISDLLIAAVHGMPEDNQFVTARILPDSTKLQPSCLATVCDIHPVGFPAEVMLSNLPPDDCRYLFCESARSLYVWCPEPAHRKTIDVYRKAAPMLMSMFPSIALAREAVFLSDFDGVPL